MEEEDKGGTPPTKTSSADMPAMLVSVHGLFLQVQQQSPLPSSSTPATRPPFGMRFPAAGTAPHPQLLLFGRSREVPLLDARAHRVQDICHLHHALVQADTAGVAALFLSSTINSGKSPNKARHARVRCQHTAAILGEHPGTYPASSSQEPPQPCQALPERRVPLSTPTPGLVIRGL